MGVIWGIPYLFIKIAVSELTPASLVFLRTAIGAGLLLPVAFARKDLGPLVPHWKWLVAYTFVEVAAPWFLLSDAERRISSSLSGLLIALVPSIGIAQLPRVLPATQVIFAVAVLGVVCTALAFLVFFPLVAEVGAARATVITYVNPAVALALGVAFLVEPLTFGIVLGFVLIA